MRESADSDVLSQRQMTLAERAYALLRAEDEVWPPEPDFAAERTLNHAAFYRAVFADHARAAGIQHTWTSFWAYHRADGFRHIDEATLRGFLAAFMLNHDEYDPRSTTPWVITTRTVTDLKDRDLFSVDHGITWHLCGYVMGGTVSVYVDADYGDDAMFRQIDAAEDDSCQVIRPART